LIQEIKEMAVNQQIHLDKTGFAPAKPNLKQQLQRGRDRLFANYEQRRLKRKAFVIISNNCWGYELYQSIGREYNTPFIGLFLFPDCYLRLLENFESLITQELQFKSQSKYYDQQKHYPIGVLGDDIEIHFLHYASEAEARNKWGRRVERMQQARNAGAELYLKLCDAENCGPAELARFHALPFSHKLSLGFQAFNHPCHLHLPYLRNKAATALVDGAKLFKKRYSYFDITHWLLTGEIAKTPRSRFLALLP
jgi:uncharacterized protein (DUF1919 family)